MTATTAFIFEATMTAAGADRRPIFSADRPESLAAADMVLAGHSLKRTAAWDLADRAVAAPVAPMDNVFNGVVAADLWAKVGTTHDQFELAAARTVENGDLVSDSELCVAYVVAGSSTESGSTKLHMVGEGQEWADRFTAWHTMIMVARKR